MKRVAVFVVCSLMILALSACSGSDGDKSVKQVNVIEQNFMPRQLEYAAEKDIPIIEFDEQNKLSSWLEKNYVDIEESPEDWVYLKIQGGLSGKRFERTMDQGEYYYTGGLKDNQPDGNGILLVYDAVTTRLTGRETYCFQYIGSFEKGRYDGYGLLFSVPTDEDVGIYAAAAIAPDLESEEFARLYADGVNYVTYEGMFEDGKRTGEGNRFVSFTSWGAEFMVDIESEFAEGVTYSTVEIGEFKDDKEDGTIKLYIDGVIRYDGEMKKGEYSGKGKYYYSNGQLRYDGEFKQSDYHGKGTLYDENGDVIYKGNWKYGDYD